MSVSKESIEIVKSNMDKGMDGFNWEFVVKEVCKQEKVDLLLHGQLAAERAATVIRGVVPNRKARWALGFSEVDHRHIAELAVFETTFFMKNIAPTLMTKVVAPTAPALPTPPAPPAPPGTTTPEVPKLEAPKVEPPKPEVKAEAKPEVKAETKPTPPAPKAPAPPVPPQSAGKKETAKA